ncbi:MAG: hypothetical protein EXR71_04110 [Myxococcales bacterium]|nr:hypothetical protein [Myxococcales bacterium]
MLAVLWLGGCFLVVDEDTFPKQYASITCARLQECWLAAFEDEYDDDMEECTDDQEDLIDAIDGGGDDFDEDEARDCLEKMQSETCGDLYSEFPRDCLRVYL